VQGLCGGLNSKRGKGQWCKEEEDAQGLGGYSVGSVGF